MPIVSVAIPVFNGETYIAEAIKSVQQQTQLADELLVFDNGSTDRTRQVCLELLEPSQIRTAPINLGAVSNFNRAARESKGTYFAWLAADDTWHPEFIDLCVAALEQQPGASACLPGIQYVSPTGERLHRSDDMLLGAVKPSTRLRSFLRRERWTETYCLYRRQSLVASPIFRDTYGADVLLTWWFVLRGPLAIVPDALLNYHVPAVPPSSDQMAQALNPTRVRPRWVKAQMWREMWVMAGADDVPATTRRSAHRELVLALAHKEWVRHLVRDALSSLRAVRR